MILEYQVYIFSLLFGKSLENDYMQLANYEPNQIHFQLKVYSLTLSPFGSFSSQNFFNSIAVADISILLLTLLQRHSRHQIHIIIFIIFQILYKLNFFLLPRQTQDSLQMLWLTAYLMGLPPTGLYTLSWTHGLTPSIPGLTIVAYYINKAVYPKIDKPLQIYY